jgi:hypothetical protein
MLFGEEPEKGKCCYCDMISPQEESQCCKSPDGIHCVHWFGSMWERPEGREMEREINCADLEVFAKYHEKFKDKKVIDLNIERAKKDFLRLLNDL